MTTKKYALLVISTEPINTKNIKNREGVEHLFSEEFYAVPREWGTSIIKHISKKQVRGSYIFDCPGRSATEAIMERLREIFSKDYKK